MENIKRRSFLKKSQNLILGTALVPGSSILLMGESCSKKMTQVRKEESISVPVIMDKEIVFMDQTTKYRAIPTDPNFRTISNLASLPRTIEVPFPWKEEKLISSNQGYITGNVFTDPKNRFLLEMMLSTPVTPDTSSGSPQYKTWYRVSNDGGRTFSEPTLVIIEGNTLENPIEGVEIGRNGYNINFTTPIIMGSSGKIIVPVNLHPWDDEKQRIYNPADAYIFQDAGALVGEWDEQDRKSTRLNSSHVAISYAVFCLKKKKKQTTLL